MPLPVRYRQGQVSALTCAGLAPQASAPLSATDEDDADGDQEGR